MRRALYTMIAYAFGTPPRRTAAPRAA